MTEPNTQGASWDEEKVRDQIETCLDADSHSGRIPSAVMFKDIEYIAERMLPIIREVASKERAEGERRGAERAVAFIKGNLDGRRLYKPKLNNEYRVQKGLLDEIFEKARTLPADSTEK